MCIYLPVFLNLYISSSIESKSVLFFQLYTFELLAFEHVHIVVCIFCFPEMPLKPCKCTHSQDTFLVAGQGGVKILLSLRSSNPSRLSSISERERGRELEVPHLSVDGRCFLALPKEGKRHQIAINNHLLSVLRRWLRWQGCLAVISDWRQQGSPLSLIVVFPIKKIADWW